MTSAGTAPKHRKLIRTNPSARRLMPIRFGGDTTSLSDYLRSSWGGQAGAVIDTDFEAAGAAHDLFPIAHHATLNRGYPAESFSGAFWDSDLRRGTQLRSYGGNPVIKARASGHYFTPDATIWQDVSSGSYFENGPSPTIAWVDVSEATTWEEVLEGHDQDDFIGQSVHAQVQTAIRAAHGELFESGYESQFRQTLRRMYCALGSRVVEAVCEQLATFGISDEILAQAFKFLVDVKDSATADLRLVSIAQFLRSESALTRDAAATALGALNDRRAAAYLREAAVRESHPTLKYDFLEIAAELDGE